jgi:hypothetical protein
MSFLRVIPIAALALGGVLAASPAAFASTAQPATVHAVRCTAPAFHVDHGAPGKVTCYAGTGTKTVDIRTVHEITAGEYYGCLVARAGNQLEFRSFRPGQPIPFLKPVELVSFQLVRHQVVCPE